MATSSEGPVPGLGGSADSRPGRLTPQPPDPERERSRREMARWRYIMAGVVVLGIAVGVGVVSITVVNIHDSDAEQQIATACVESGGEWTVGPYGQWECLREDGGPVAVPVPSPSDSGDDGATLQR